MEAYCIAKGYQIVRVVKEVGSGVNDHRKLLLKLLEQTDYNLIVVEHKDRLSRVGFNYLKVLLTQTNRDIEVVNLAEERKDDLMEDFVSIITSFCARLYSLRQRNRKTECLIKCLEQLLPLQAASWLGWTWQPCSGPWPVIRGPCSGLDAPRQTDRWCQMLLHAARPGQDSPGLG